MARDIALIGCLLVLAALGGCQAEQYEKADTAALRIEMKASIRSIQSEVHFGNSGAISRIDGVVKKLTVAGKPIELATDKFVDEGNDAFIITKKIGKIKVTFERSGLALWVTATQRKLLGEMAR
jgi:hypothetical protein